MIKKWLYKIDRILIWPLLFATIIFFLSGFSLTQRFYIHKIFPHHLAAELHFPFCIALLVLFLLHSLIGFYFAILRKSSKPHLSIVLARWLGWLLFVSMSMMFIGGYVMNGFWNVFDISTASRIHTIFAFLSIILFFVHAGIHVYFIVRKWVRRLNR